MSCFAADPAAGDHTDGVWSCTVTIPQGAEAGTWLVSDVYARDVLGQGKFYQTAELQALGFPTELDVTSATPDTDPPALVDFDFNPKQVDVSAEVENKTCTSTIGLTDYAGVVQGQTFLERFEAHRDRRACLASQPIPLRGTTPTASGVAR